MGHTQQLAIAIIFTAIACTTTVSNVLSAQTPFICAVDTTGLLLMQSPVDDGRIVKSLIVLVRFRDEAYEPNRYWWPLSGSPSELQRPLDLHSALFAPSSNPSTFEDSTVSDYFYKQSVSVPPSALTPFIMYADVWGNVPGRV